MTRRKMMLSAAGLFTIIAVFFLNSCAPRYELTVTGLSGGSVSIEPSGGAYKEGEVVTLTAIPDSGHSFTGWGNISNFSADNEIGREVEIIMPAENLDISVNFSIPSDGWTFMVYMAGDNSLSNQVYYDLDEIEQGLYDAVQAGNSFLAEDVQVLVLTDRSGSDDTKLFRVLPDSDNTEIVSSVIEYGNYSSSSELNMADPDTLQDFVSYGFAKYPSQYNALVLWNHGGGVKSLDNSELISKEICEDVIDGEKDYLYLNEVQSAVAAALGNGKLDILGIDACIMGEVETAYQMKDIADYFVASMALEWGAGWGYEHIFNNFSSAGNPPEPPELADILVSQFYYSTKGISNIYPNTMTAVDTAALVDLKDEIDTLAALIHDSGKQTEFEACRDNSVKYFDTDSASELQQTPYYDLYSLCNELKSLADFASTGVDTQAQVVQDNLAVAVVACYGDSISLGLDYYETDDTASKYGLSIFISDSSSNYENQWWYTIDDVDASYVGSDVVFTMGGIDFCTYDSDGDVETWRELFEAWYDDYPEINDGNGYTQGTF